MERRRGCALVVGVLLPAVWAWGASEETVRYSYDDDGRLTSALYAQSGTNAAVAMTYDDNGNRLLLSEAGPSDTSADRDGDALPDLLEVVYFGNLAQDGRGDPDADGLVNSNEMAAAGHPLRGDTDGDTQNDHDEFIAGTALDNASDLFRIREIQAGDFDVYSVLWDARAGRTYELDLRPDLTTGRWNAVGAAYVAHSNSLQHLHATNTPPAYYRLRVRLSP